MQEYNIWAYTAHNLKSMTRRPPLDRIESLTIIRQNSGGSEYYKRERDSLINVWYGSYLAHADYSVTGGKLIIYRKKTLQLGEEKPYELPQ